MIEAGLLIKLREGDEKTFRDFVESHRIKVYNTAIGLLHDEANAEDITQEVFLEVFRSVAGFKGECSITTWIYRITVRKSLEFIRKSRRRKRSGILLSIFRNEEHAKVASDGPFYHPGVKLENKERAAILFRAIAELPLGQRTVFTLHKMEGLSHQQIADVTKNSVSSVESLMVRAKRNLRKILSEYYEKNEK